ncbi:MULTISPECIES: CocE/NonD family hydrolase [Streptomyces]|uniref:X-prolyl-dipeptidyl aminopeptidase n=1 Tax=Streptomyces rimosus subsp. rimosus TaxID=132474 RepID=A0ABY3YVE1_STRRM|nr:peptidase S15 [Streptomyces rimosus]UNZ01908.1 x-prolyl-dipeptidyl aminopeptidase [Streptomyces rimosus subsp. rimosus]UTH99323.1 x-prolyl-dipeptidyl aminopeptidase [Streptomyces rimosus subsp. rimosus]UTJ17421.1 x-prolyl-dipeptidyl aminopeptidase [Streptomyces rimosus subsp. rimosus]UTJ18849.1 x-prolyl-dipeptidyl aminopeptidase [Streptomyces rimosus subsp. rimosus]
MPSVSSALPGAASRPVRRAARTRSARLPVTASVCLAACAALLGPVTAAGPAGAAGPRQPGYAVTPLKLPVRAGGRDCNLDADLYRPTGVDALHPAPAVVTTNGFGGSKSDGSTDAIARAFASRGYVALAYSGLGFGRTGCPISLDDPRIDGRAASQILDFLAGQRAAKNGVRVDFVTKDGPRDPRVGMFGGSYGGAIQLATASADERLDALVPLITWHDLTYALAPNNADRTSGVAGPAPGAYKHQWTNGFYLIGEAQGLLHPRLDPSRGGGAGCVHFVAPACELKKRLNSNRYPSAPTEAALDYARSVSPTSYLATVRTPTLLVQGQADTLFNLNEAAATFETLRAQGTDTAMIWQSWGHSGGMTDPAPGELDLGKGNFDTSYVGRRTLAWFGRYLRREWDTDTGPAFAYYRDWAAHGPAYAASEVYPVGIPRRLYLSGDGKLVDNPADVATGSRHYRNWRVASSHSESSLAALMKLPNPKPYDTRGTYLDWASEPVRGRPVDVVGSPRATLRVHSPDAERTQHSDDAADRLLLFLKLYDVAPNGGKTLVHRLVAPVRVPDVTREFTVNLPAIVHRFAPGHRLRLVMAAGDTAYFGNRGSKQVTVSSTRARTGTLDLPVVGEGVEGLDDDLP